VDKFGINGWMLFFQVVHFLIMLWLLNKLLYKPIMNAFASRKERIANSLAEAEQVAARAAEERQALEAQIAAERREAQGRLQQAVATSEEAAKKRLAEANAEADALLAKAREEAAATRQSALAGVQADITDLALAAAAKVVGASVDEKRHRELIANFLQKEIGEVA